jgi:hypothetical protein
MIIPAGYAQLNFVHSGTAAPTGAEVTLGVDHVNQDLDVIAAAALALWEAQIIGNLTSQIRLDGVLVKKGPNDTGPSGFFPSGEEGSYGESATPPNVSLLVHKVTDMGGRQGRGRMFIPGFREDRVSGEGIVQASDVTSINTALTTFFDGMETADLRLALLRSEGSPITAPELLTGLQLDTRVATQRRRLRR